MPRIQAATVAEHHAQQRRALLTAARELLAETAEAPSMGAVGRRAGLARSSVYQYFTSPQDLLAAVVADVFPDWADQVTTAVTAASSPGARVWAYIEANVALFASSEQAVARALASVVEPDVLKGPMEAFHAQLQQPLVQALSDLGEPEPTVMADYVDQLVLNATRGLRDDPPLQAGVDADAVLAPLRRLLGGYLHLDDDGRPRRPRPTGRTGGRRPRPEG